jgi:hypothetical protein
MVIHLACSRMQSCILCQGMIPPSGLEATSLMVFSASANGVIQLERQVIWSSQAIPRSAQCAELAQNSLRRRLNSGKRARKGN